MSLPAERLPTPDPLPSGDASAASPPVEAVSTIVAAVLIGVSPRRIRQLIEDSWAALGMAWQVGGEWMIDRRADARLTDKTWFNHRDLEQLAGLVRDGTRPDLIEIAKFRREALERFELSGLRPNERIALERIVNAMLAEEKLGRPGFRNLSKSSLYAWRTAYRKGGIAALVPGFDKRVGGERIEVGEAAIEEAMNYLLGPNALKEQAVFEIITGKAAERPTDPAWVTGSKSTFFKAIRERLPAAVKTLAHKGQRAARANCIPKLQSDFEAVGAGEEYVADTRHLDTWCRVQTSRGWRAVRLYLTAMQDRRSRMIVGWVLAPFADTSTVLEALKRAIRDYGKPRILRTDQGKDYRAAKRHGAIERPDGTKTETVLRELGIAARGVAAYTPWAKLIESHFRGMKDTLDRLYQSFWGGCPLERHEEKAKWVKENLHKLPTLAQIEADYRTYLDGYHSKPHSAPDLFGMTPLQAMTELRTEPARMESAAVLDMLFRVFTKSKLVRRDGVKHLTYWYGNGDPKLFTMRGQRVILSFDLSDMGTARVHDLQRRPMFDIACLAVTGWSQREVLAALKQRRDIIKPYAAQVKKAREFMARKSPSELLAERAAGQRALYGDGKPSARQIAESPAPTLRVRPDLEDAIAQCSPAQGSEAASKAIRTGTDDDGIDLFDLIGDEPPPQTHRPASRNDVDDEEEYSYLDFIDDLIPRESTESCSGGDADHADEFAESLMADAGLGDADDDSFDAAPDEADLSADDAGDVDTPPDFDFDDGEDDDA